MDVSYSITDVKPTMVDGTLVAAAFTITATDTAGNAESNEGQGFGPFPVPADVDVGYTDDEYRTICQKISDDSGLSNHLKNVVDGKRTPMYVAPAIVAISDDDKKAMWMNQVDSNAALVYNQFTRFQVEYEQRELAAQSYKDAGYTGDPTVWITAFADSNGIDYKTCADLILSQAETLRNAVVQLGGLRMNKYKIKNALTIDDADTQFMSIINGIASLARNLP